MSKERTKGQNYFYEEIKLCLSIAMSEPEFSVNQELSAIRDGVNALQTLGLLGDYVEELGRDLLIAEQDEPRSGAV